MTDTKSDKKSSESGPVAIISGASGLLGSHLAVALRDAGWCVRPLVRRSPNSDLGEIAWEPLVGQVEPELLEGVDAIIHLGGAPIAGKRWTAGYKSEIYDSRVNSTRLLAETIAGLDRKPRIFVCASASGYYGDCCDEPFGEDREAGSDFLATVARDWESATESARQAGIRVVNIRTGMVLSKAGGALSAMLPPFKFGFGGVLGSGQQYISWISIVDWVRLVMFLMDRDDAMGPFNATAPNPVTNREFTKTLGHVLHRPTVCNVPTFVLRTVFGELAEAVLLGGSRVLPMKAQSLGFEFEHPALELALRAVLAKT